MQYYSGIVAGNGGNPALHGWFPIGEDDRRRDDIFAKDYAAKFFEKYGESVECDHFYPNGETQPFGKYDLNIWTDWGEDGLTSILPYVPLECPHPMAYWASDTHLGYEYRLKMAKKSDLVFCAQKRAVEDMRRDGIENPICFLMRLNRLLTQNLILLQKI